MCIRDSTRDLFFLLVAQVTGHCSPDATKGLLMYDFLSNHLGISTVSYTHLDVYKRQYWACTGAIIASLKAYYGFSLALSNVVTGLSGTLPILPLAGGLAYERTTCLLYPSGSALWACFDKKRLCFWA